MGINFAEMINNLEYLYILQPLEMQISLYKQKQIIITIVYVDKT